jgi:hypothetical protein
MVAAINLPMFSNFQARYFKRIGPYFTMFSRSRT